jgi:hypothetical protein
MTSESGSHGGYELETKGMLVLFPAWTLRLPEKMEPLPTVPEKVPLALPPFSLFVPPLLVLASFPPES